MFPNLDSSRIHCSQNCQARAAWIPAGSALQVPSHITEHNLESFYFAVGCAKFLDVQYEIDLSKRCPANTCWAVGSSLGQRGDAGWLWQTCSGPSFCTCSGAGSSEQCCAWLLVQVSLQITSSSCCYGNIKKNFLIKSEGTHSGKCTEVSQTKAFLLQAAQDMTQGTRLNKQGQIKWAGLTWSRKHCCWWWIEFFFQSAEFIFAKC